MIFSWTMSTYLNYTTNVLTFRSCNGYVVLYPFYEYSWVFLKRDWSIDARRVEDNLTRNLKVLDIFHYFFLGSTAHDLNFENFQIKIWTSFGKLRCVTSCSCRTNPWAFHSVSALGLRCCRVKIFLFVFIFVCFKQIYQAFTSKGKWKLHIFGGTGNFTISPRSEAPI